MTGKADIILMLSRESEFPGRIVWDSKLTSYGPEAKQVQSPKSRPTVAQDFVSVIFEPSPP